MMDPDATEAEIVDNHRLDHLYTNPFRDGRGKYFTVVSVDSAGLPDIVDAEAQQSSRNKVKTRLTFIKTEDGGHIKAIELKRFKFYSQHGYLRCRNVYQQTFGDQLVYLLRALVPKKSQNNSKDTQTRID